MDARGPSKPGQLKEGGPRHGGSVCISVLYEGGGGGPAEPSRDVPQPCAHLQGALASLPGAAQRYVYLDSLSPSSPSSQPAHLASMRVCCASPFLSLQVSTG